MRIEQLMTSAPVSCRPGHSLSQVAQVMWSHDCGCLPVETDDGSQRVVGVITDRDICMAAHFEGKHLSEIKVAEAMTRNVWACNPGDSLGEAEVIMQEAQVRRLPVVGGRDRLLGMLSLADLAREAVWQHGSERPQITEAEVGVVLAMICQPHSLGRPAPDE